MDVGKDNNTLPSSINTDYPITIVPYVVANARHLIVL